MKRRASVDFGPVCKRLDFDTAVKDNLHVPGLTDEPVFRHFQNILHDFGFPRIRIQSKAPNWIPGPALDSRVGVRVEVVYVESQCALYCSMLSMTSEPTGPDLCHKCYAFSLHYLPSRLFSFQHYKVDKLGVEEVCFLASQAHTKCWSTLHGGLLDRVGMWKRAFADDLVSRPYRIGALEDVVTSRYTDSRITIRSRLKNPKFGTVNIELMNKLSVVMICDLDVCFMEVLTCIRKVLSTFAFGYPSHFSAACARLEAMVDKTMRFIYMLPVGTFTSKGCRILQQQKDSVWVDPKAILSGLLPQEVVALVWEYATYPESIFERQVGEFVQIKPAPRLYLRNYNEIDWNQYAIDWDYAKRHRLEKDGEDNVLPLQSGFYDDRDNLIDDLLRRDYCNQQVSFIKPVLCDFLPYTTSAYTFGQIVLFNWWIRALIQGLSKLSLPCHTVYVRSNCLNQPLGLLGLWEKKHRIHFLEEGVRWHTTLFEHVSSHGNTLDTSRFMQFLLNEFEPSSFNQRWSQMQFGTSTHWDISNFEPISEYEIAHPACFYPCFHRDRNP